jgi:arsenate reductase
MRVLFVCVENSGRSQMAEAFAKKLGVDATSAGTLPGTAINSVVVEVMRESGFDLSTNRPKLLTMDMVNAADLVITMGCSVDRLCPAPMIANMQKKLVDWNLDDPKGEPIEKVREIRNEIEHRVGELVRPAAGTSLWDGQSV